MDIVFETAVKYNDIFMAGAKITIIISFLSCFFGLFLGVILAFMKISGVKILQAVAAVYVEVIRTAKSFHAISLPPQRVAYQIADAFIIFHTVNQHIILPVAPMYRINRFSSIILQHTALPS